MINKKKHLGGQGITQLNSGKHDVIYSGDPK